MTTLRERFEQACLAQLGRSVMESLQKIVYPHHVTGVSGQSQWDNLLDALVAAVPQVTREQISAICFKHQRAFKREPEGWMPSELIDDIYALYAPEPQRWCEHIRYHAEMSETNERWQFEQQGWYIDKLFQQAWRCCPVCFTHRPRCTCNQCATPRPAR